MVYALAMLLLASGTLLVTNSAFGEEQSKIELAGAATVTIDEAIKTASEKLAGKIIEAELERKHNKLVWEVEVVTAENKVMEIHIDAKTGVVIDIEEEEEKTKSGRLKRPRSGSGAAGTDGMRDQ
ncbi:MAG: PepSY domain-containing protein [Nitrospira sp.]|nr:PepSY domain-containing protein [Nitrospira sp.]